MKLGHSTIENTNKQHRFIYGLGKKKKTQRLKRLLSWKKKIIQEEPINVFLNINTRNRYIHTYVKTQLYYVLESLFS